jgi:hypothetical protein
MFSKFLFTIPLKASDSMTVSSAIFQLFTQFGLCNTFISDRGSEFISQCTNKFCEMLNIHQNFTPSFVHHSLGACERTHRTLNERITPYISQGKQWDNILPAITFAINSSVNSSKDKM